MGAVRAGVRLQPLRVIVQNISHVIVAPDVARGAGIVLHGNVQGSENIILNEVGARVASHENPISVIGAIIALALVKVAVSYLTTHRIIGPNMAPVALGGLHV